MDASGGSGGGGAAAAAAAAAFNVFPVFEATFSDEDEAAVAIVLSNAASRPSASVASSSNMESSSLSPAFSLCAGRLLSGRPRRLSSSNSGCHRLVVISTMPSSMQSMRRQCVGFCSFRRLRLGVRFASSSHGLRSSSSITSSPSSSKLFARPLPPWLSLVHACSTDAAISAAIRRIAGFTDCVHFL